MSADQNHGTTSIARSVGTWTAKKTHRGRGETTVVETGDVSAVLFTLSAALGGALAAMAVWRRLRASTA